MQFFIKFRIIIFLNSSDWQWAPCVSVSSGEMCIKGREITFTSAQVTARSLPMTAQHWVSKANQGPASHLQVVIRANELYFGSEGWWLSNFHQGLGVSETSVLMSHMSPMSHSVTPGTIIYLITQTTLRTSITHLTSQTIPYIAILLNSNLAVVWLNYLYPGDSEHIKWWVSHQ